MEASRECQENRLTNSCSRTKSYCHSFCEGHKSHASTLSPLKKGVRSHMATLEEFNRLSISIGDLEQAVAYAERASTTPRSDISHQALLLSAIICYFRPFSQNERSAAARATTALRITDFTTLSGPEQELHNQCKRLRNKALAHSEWEMNPTALDEGSGMITSRPFDLLANAPDPAKLASLARKMADICHHRRADHIHHPGGGASAT